MKLPTPADVVRHSAQQIEALAQLPESILIFNRSLNTFAQTIGRLDNVIRRVDRLTAPLEAPMNVLAPRLEALVPIIEEHTVEEWVDVVQRSVMPALQMMGETQYQIRSIATSVEQLIRVMEEMFSRLQEIPGVSLMTRFMPGGRPPSPMPTPAAPAAPVAPAGPGTATSPTAGPPGTPGEGSRSPTG